MVYECTTYPILPCSHCVQEADGPVLVWSGVPFLHEQQEEEEEAAGVSEAGHLTAAKDDLLKAARCCLYLHLSALLGC